MVLAKGLKIVTGHQYYADRFADFIDRHCRTSFQLVSQAHPAHISLRGVFPVAKSKLKTVLLYGRNYQRVDVIGLVTSVEEQSLKIGNKTHLWLKDESNTQVLINLWGITVEKARQVRPGDVAQVDNAILTKHDGESVSAFAGDGSDSKHGFCAWLHTTPHGAQVERLTQLSTTDLGTKIADAWQGSLSKGTIATCHEFNMGDQKPRLIVGCQRCFPLDPQDGKVFYTEMEQQHRTLSGGHIERVAKKRPADHLVNDTPQKTRTGPIN